MVASAVIGGWKSRHKAGTGGCNPGVVRGCRGGGQTHCRADHHPECLILAGLCFQVCRCCWQNSTIAGWTPNQECTSGGLEGIFGKWLAKRHSEVGNAVGVQGLAVTKWLVGRWGFYPCSSAALGHGIPRLDLEPCGRAVGAPCLGSPA